MSHENMHLVCSICMSQWLHNVMYAWLYIHDVIYNKHPFSYYILSLSHISTSSLPPFVPDCYVHDKQKPSLWYLDSVSPTAVEPWVKVSTGKNVDLKMRQQFKAWTIDWLVDEYNYSSVRKTAKDHRWPAWIMNDSNYLSEGTRDTKTVLRTSFWSCQENY